MRQQTPKTAFTLVELLVVISIILIASSIIFIGGSGGSGAALSSSARIVSGIASGARGQAILKNARTRLIIHDDVASDPDKYLRFFGIIYEDTTTTASNDWIAATQGTYLPEGIYFSPDLSDDHSWPRSRMSIEYPRLKAETAGSGDDFFYYEFQSNGTIASAFANAYLVLQAGVLKPNPTEFEVVVESGQELLVSGLIFRRGGTTTKVTDPADLLP